MVQVLHSRAIQFIARSGNCGMSLSKMPCLHLLQSSHLEMCPGVAGDLYCSGLISLPLVFQLYWLNDTKTRDKYLKMSWYCWKSMLQSVCIPPIDTSVLLA